MPNTLKVTIAGLDEAFADVLVVPTGKDGRLASKPRNVSARPPPPALLRWPRPKPSPARQARSWRCRPKPASATR